MLIQKPKYILLFCFLLCFSINLSHAKTNKLELTIGQQKLNIEVADNDAKRRLGLMQRDYLAPNAGMLFLFESTDYHCFWMKNTLIPLSIAFIDNNNTIVDIQDMAAKSLDTHCPNQAVNQALEMNLGWFRKNQIKIGDQIQY